MPAPSAAERLRQALRTAASDRRGATLVEFAIVAPVLCLLLVGAFDIAHTLYMRATLQGILQKAARDSALESGTEASNRSVIDEKVRAQVAAIANNAKIDYSRRFYRTFSDASAARAEDYDDTNRNGTCDGGEPFEDTNNNGVWDRDGGDGGQGGAKDATIYTVTVTYPRFFPLYRMVGGSSQARVEAKTVLKNQPYGDQGNYAKPKIGNCT